MTIFLTAILCCATLVFVFGPLFSRDETPKIWAHERERWLSVPQLELDRALGKIDDAEFEELKQRANQESVYLSPLEAAIFTFRWVRRADKSIEAEILVARARKKKNAS